MNRRTKPADILSTAPIADALALRPLTAVRDAFNAREGTSLSTFKVRRILASAERKLAEHLAAVVIGGDR